MNAIGISIVVPVYNVEEYIQEFLESVFSQSYKNFEIILVNDGSTDLSEEIILGYQKKYSNIKYIYQKNSGQAKARNTAFSYIEGKYTLYLDPDDYIEKDMLLEMFNCAEKNLADMVICGYRKVYENKKEVVNLYELCEAVKYNSQKLLNMIVNFKMDGYLWNKMFLTKNLVDNNIYFEEGRIIEDLFPVCKQFSYSKTIMYINKPLYNYRQRLTSSLNKAKNLKKINDHHYAYKSVCNLVKDKAYIEIDDYVDFVANLQFLSIKEYKRINTKIDKLIYNKYFIDRFKIRDVLFKYNISNKSRIKIILYQMNIMHKFI